MRAVVRNPHIIAARSAPSGSLRYRGSITGLASGSAERRLISPRLYGLSRIGPDTTA